MNPGELRYAIVTPTRNERSNLRRLAESIGRQTVTPSAWVIVDTGSTDGTLVSAEQLRSRLPFVRTISIGGPARPVRGGPIVRAFVAGTHTLHPPPDVVVKLDADLSFAPDYFERVLATFAADERLGLASGICSELRDGEWRLLYGTRSHVWGAARAYRWKCLEEILPLDEREGWDEIDSLKAQVRGWRARTLADVPFRHHRAEGLRDGSRRRWFGQGRTSHYMGYRFSYLLARAVWRAREDPVALVMIGGYVSAAVRREPRCADRAVRARLRREQDLRRLPRRLRESLGRVV